MFVRRERHPFTVAMHKAIYVEFIGTVFNGNFDLYVARVAYMIDIIMR